MMTPGRPVLYPTGSAADFNPTDVCRARQHRAARGDGSWAPQGQRFHMPDCRYPNRALHPRNSLHNGFGG